MSNRDFIELLNGRWAKEKFACVGLDTDYERIPEHLRNSVLPPQYAMTSFNMDIIEATAEFVGTYKLNPAFYLMRGKEGLVTLHETVTHIKAVDATIPVILDGKFGDTKNSSEAYASFAFDWLGVDAVTVNPYFGKEACAPFLKRADKGVIALCRTSNAGAEEFQNRIVMPTEAEEDRWELSLRSDVPQHPMPMYQLVAHAVKYDWNVYDNCALVVGATYPEELREVRKIVGEMPILSSGVGRQGGNLERVVRAGRNRADAGMIISSSYAVIFASKEKDFAEAAGREAKKLNDEINRLRVLV